MEGFLEMEKAVLSTPSRTRRNFNIALAGPTEQQVMDQRLAAYQVNYVERPIYMYVPVYMYISVTH